MAVPSALLRRLESTDEGTFGQFQFGGLVLLSGELPWRDNAASVSCIPTGSYEARLGFSPRFGRPLYAIGPVAGRTGIRMHGANLMGDISKRYRCQLNGCIALGERLGYIDGQKALLLSAPAMRRFLDATGGQPFTLEIR